MTDRNTQIDLRISRAERHLEEFREATALYFERRPFRIQMVETDEGRVYLVRVVEEVPEDLSLPLGDALSNLRAALDYVIWRLIEANGQQPNESDYFPITKSQTGFEGNVKGLKGRISAEARRRLLEIQAYPGGAGNSLFELNSMNNLHKHRLLIPVGTSYEGFSLSIREMVSASFNLPSDFTQSILFSPSDKLYPIKDGTVVYVDKVKASPEPQKPTFEFRLAIGELQGQDAEETLLEFLRDVQNAAATFRDLLR